MVESDTHGINIEIVTTHVGWELLVGVQFKWPLKDKKILMLPNFINWSNPQCLICLWIS